MSEEPITETVPQSTTETFGNVMTALISVAFPDGTAYTDYWKLEDGDHTIPVRRNATRVEYRVEWDNLDQNPAEWYACLVGADHVCVKGMSPLVVTLEGENVTPGTYYPRFFVAQRDEVPVGADFEMEARWTAKVSYPAASA